MSKYKINYGLAAILLIASFFGGWQTMLIVSALLFIFCEIKDNLKDLAINLVSFSIGIQLVKIFWSIIYKASILIPSVLEKLVGVINYYLDYSNKISLDKFNTYVVSPITDLFDIGDSIFGYLIIIAEFVFITSLLIGKNRKGLVVGSYISKYVDKILNFIFNFNVSQNIPQPVQNNVYQSQPVIQNGNMVNPQFQNQNINNQQTDINTQNPVN